MTPEDSCCGARSDTVLRTTLPFWLSVGGGVGFGLLSWLFFASGYAWLSGASGPYAFGALDVLTFCCGATAGPLCASRRVNDIWRVEGSKLRSSRGIVMSLPQGTHARLVPLFKGSSVIGKIVLTSSTESVEIEWPSTPDDWRSALQQVGVAVTCR